MGAASVEIGSAPSIARHLLLSSRREIARGFGLCLPGRAVRLDDAQCIMLDATALSILPIMMAPLSVQIARGCLEGVLQSRVLSVPASAGGPHQQGAGVGLRQTGPRLTSIP